MKSLRLSLAFAAMLLAPIALSAQAAPNATTADAPASKIPPDQQPTKEQLKKLFEVMRLREQFQSLMKSMTTMVQQQVDAQVSRAQSKADGGKLSPEDQAKFKKLMDDYLQKAMNLYTVDEVLEDMTTIYQRHLSREDIDALIAFYSSPAGQHLLTEQPAIMKEYMPLVVGRITERSKALTNDLAQQLKELDAAQGKTAPAKN